MEVCEHKLLSAVGHWMWGCVSMNVWVRSHLAHWGAWAQTLECAFTLHMEMCEHERLSALTRSHIEWKMGRRVDEWTYLGVLLKSDSIFNCSVQERIKKFYKCANVISELTAEWMNWWTRYVAISGISLHSSSIICHWDHPCVKSWWKAPTPSCP